METTTQITRAPSSGQQAEQTWHVMPADDVAEQLQVDPEHGLSVAEAAARIDRFGPNRFTQTTTEPRWKAFLRQYRDPMQIVLLAAGIGSLYPLKEPGTAFV